MHCTRLAGNAGRNKSPKNRRLGTIAQLVGLYLRNEATYRQQYLIHMSPHYGELQLTIAAEIVSLVWGTPANFNGFHVLASLLQRRRSTEANQIFP